LPTAHAKVLFISETKTSKFGKIQLVNHFNMGDGLVVPSDSRKGGLWILWDIDIDLSVVSSSSNLILASLVNTSTNEAFNLVCIYGDPLHVNLQDLWSEVASFVDVNSGKPTLCMGDFNDLMYPHE
jgi:hypothetical protein